MTAFETCALFMWSLTLVMAWTGLRATLKVIRTWVIAGLRAHAAAHSLEMERE